MMHDAYASPVKMPVMCAVALLPEQAVQQCHMLLGSAAAPEPHTVFLHRTSIQNRSIDHEKTSTAVSKRCSLTNDQATQHMYL
jgi:hypothetical protein